MTIRRGNSIIAGNAADIPSQTGQSGKFLTTNGSACSWATVSADTSDCVKLTGNQDINGEKYFYSNFFRANSNDIRTVTPASTLQSQIAYLDQNGNTSAVLEYQHTTTGDSKLVLSVVGQDDNYMAIPLTIGRTSSGTDFTSAPTPSVSSNNTNIATTAYVNTKFQVVSALPASPDPDTYYFIPES